MIPQCTHHHQDLYAAVLWGIFALTSLTASICLTWVAFEKFRTVRPNFNWLFLDKQFVIVTCAVRVVSIVTLVTISPWLPRKHLAHTWGYELPTYLYVVGLAHFATQAYLQVDTLGSDISVDSSGSACCCLSSGLKDGLTRFFTSYSLVVYCVIAGVALGISSVLSIVIDHQKPGSDIAQWVGYCTLAILVMSIVILMCLLTKLVMQQSKLIPSNTGADHKSAATVCRVVLPVFSRMKFVLPALVLAFIMELILTSVASWAKNISIAIHPPFTASHCPITWATAFWITGFDLAPTIMWAWCFSCQPFEKEHVIIVPGRGPEPEENGSFLTSYSEQPVDSPTSFPSYGGFSSSIEAKPLLSQVSHL
eukprot:TRINITY_DN67253_c11_g2_i2.p1 TRINITY_DN67253_c11_g2~~TRINITY_DN67253_c11_g2_i2.p1  ORF type:complete len:365 (+),score=-30.17 TRINITY_DN67253_c11_g2_i2:58-1152(+)